MTAVTRTQGSRGLRAALIAAGLQIAREGGPEALGLRVITRAVGVSPNAAYRHFKDRRDLVMVVAHEAQRLLAESMTAGMNSSIEGVGQADSVENLRGIGMGYIQFALAEPGWFELAVLTHSADSVTAPSDQTEAPPFLLLLRVLDEMVRSGALSESRRPAAEWVCWSAVHGFAELATRGPICHQDRQTLNALGRHVVDAAVRSLTG